MTNIGTFEYIGKAYEKPNLGHKIIGVFTALLFIAAVGMIIWGLAQIAVGGDLINRNFTYYDPKRSARAWALINQGLIHLGIGVGIAAGGVLIPIVAAFILCRLFPQPKEQTTIDVLNTLEDPAA